MATATISAARAGKDARQKKIVIVGAVLLAIVLVIQVPRMMKQMNGSSAAPATPAPATPQPAPSAPATPSPAPATEVPSSTSTDKLVSFESFNSKDPFIQQVSADVAPAATSEGSGTTSGSSEGTSGDGTFTEAQTEPAGGSLPAAAGFATGGAETTPPASPKLVSASIKVNGSVQTVDKGKTFPRSDPVFKLVSVTADSVEVAIADGSLKAGKTVKITSGKPVTLQNTADGKRYRLELISTTTS